LTSTENWHKRPDNRRWKVLRRELRDRFGPPPRARLICCCRSAELKNPRERAGRRCDRNKRGQADADRNNDYITLAGKFPRLTKREPKARLNEIKKFLVRAMTGASSPPEPSLQAAAA